MTPRAPLLLSLLAASACAAPRTSIVVVVDAEPAVREATSSLLVEVRSGPERTVLLHYVVEAEELQWPSHVLLVPADGAAVRREVRTTVRAFSGPTASGSLVSSRHAASLYLDGVDGRVDLRLDAACGEVRCDVSADETCYQGECVAVSLQPPRASWEGE
jgi:hypothetical protein